MIGTYECIIADHVLAESKNGTPSIKIKLQAGNNVLDGTVPAVGVLYCDLWLTEKAIERSLDTITKVTGWTGDDLSELNGTGRFIGQPAWVVCDEESYDNGMGVEMKTKVKFLNPVGGSGPKAADADTAKVLSESLRGRIMKFRKDNPNPVLPKKEDPAPPASDPVDQMDGDF